MPEWRRGDLRLVVVSRPVHDLPVKATDVESTTEAAPLPACIDARFDEQPQIPGSAPVPSAILRRRLPPHPASIGEADRLVRSLVTSARRDELLRPTAQLVSIVITEAVLSAHTRVDLCCTIVADQLRCTVGEDNLRSSAHPSDPRAFFGNRRVPTVLDRVADNWGVIPTPDGSTVWFLLSAPSAPQRQTRRDARPHHRAPEH
jgi:hypothetical protein